MNRYDDERAPLIHTHHHHEEGHTPMRKHWGITVVAVCCAALVALQCTQPKENASATDEATVRQITPAWFKAYNAGDADGVAALYAENAVLSPPGAPAAHGMQAIREYLMKDVGGAAASGLTLVAGSSTDFGMSGDLAWDSGTFTAMDKSGNSVDAGKYVTVYAKKDGKWSIIRDIWNSDGPMETKAN